MNVALHLSDFQAEFMVGGWGLSIEALMSALGQKQTCAVQQPMSALPPIATEKADIAAQSKPFTLHG
jgi:hypothetical protein